MNYIYYLIAVLRSSVGQNACTEIAGSQDISISDKEPNVVFLAMQVSTDARTTSAAGVIVQLLPGLCIQKILAAVQVMNAS